jgi:hypothetical protein
MTDIVLNPINSGYNLNKINNNFEVIEDVINDEMLHTEGGNNVMSQELDMNSFHILNSPKPVEPTHLVRLIDLEGGLSASTAFDSVVLAKAGSYKGGELSVTKSYYNRSAEDTRGGATYRVVPIADYTGTPDGFGDHLTDDGQFVLKLIHNGLLRASQFGATGSGGTASVVDDTAALQAMIVAGTSTSVLECYPMYLEKGIYEISASLVVPESARFTMFSDSRSGSARIRVSESSVPIGSPLPSVFQFTTPASIHMYNMAIWGSERATDLLDGLQDQQGMGFGFRQSLFDNLQLHGVRQGGSAINGASWFCTVKNCDIAGYGDVDSPTTWLGDGVRIAQASNGTNILNNYIRRLDIGITNSAAGSNDLVNIKGNTFDKLNLTGVYLFRSTRKVSITNNYWEGVVENGSAGIDVPTFSGTTNVSAPIIIATPTTDTVGGIAQSVTITDNNFIAGYSDSIIGFSGIFKGDVLRNNVRYKGGSTTAQHNEFVRVFGYGTFTSSRFQRSLLLEGNDLWKERAPNFEPSVQKVITFETDLTAVNWRYFEGVVVKDSLTREVYNLTSLFDSSFLTLNDRNTRYTTVWDTAAKDVIRVEKNVGGTVVPIDLSQHLERVKGTYVRVEMETMSDQAGIRPELRFDDGVNVTRVEGSDGDFAQSEFGYSDFPLYIDENATQLEVEYSTLGSDGSIMYIRNINIVPIYVDVKAGAVSNEVARREQPTSGFWNRGDFVRNRLYDADTAYGWACTAGGEGGTWEEVGSKALFLNDEIPKTVFGNYSLLAGDRGRTIKCASDSVANGVTIPLGSGMVENGTVIIIQTGDEPAVITADAGVDLNEIDGGSVTLSGKWKGGSLTKTGDNEWQWLGDGSVS